MKILFLLLTIFLQIPSPKAQAQVVSTQERFQDLFTTAGYGTAFGAALGAAILPFQENPEKNLRLVAVGASLGFIGGSLLGSYIIFSPGIVDSPLPQTKNSVIAISPLLDKKGQEWKGIRGSLTLAEF